MQADNMIMGLVKQTIKKVWLDNGYRNVLENQNKA